MNDAKPQFDYQNFDLLIEPAGHAYVARVTHSPAGEAATKFSVPFSALELENFLLKIGRPRRGVRRLNSPEMEAAKVFGKRLFDSVFGSEVFGCLRSSLDQTEAKGSAGLRLRLRLNAPELADLPWEYLYNSALNRFLVLAVETPLVRYIELPERIRPLAVQPPLKILVMLSSPTDYPSLDVEDEWAKLQNALGDLQKRKLVTLERLDEATLPALQRRLRQSSCHIFHFIGHGGYDESAHDGVLLMEDETRHSRKVSGQFLGTILHNHRPLRLAVLNACEGARASRTDPFTGTAQSLVQQGLPAVIAMQFEITDAAAITLSHEFYTALADGYPVDAALVEARTAIFAGGNDVEWGTPVLYMRAPDGKIFDIDRVQQTPLPSPEPPGPKELPVSPPRKRETPKPKEPPVSPPSRQPIAEKPKLMAPLPQKPPVSSQRQWLIAGIALTLVVIVWLIYKNSEWGQAPAQQKPAAARLSIADSLYLKHKIDGDVFFKQAEYGRAKDQYEQALSYRDNDSYLTKQIKECDRLLLAAKRPPETPVETKPKPKYTLRRTGKESLSAEAVKNMLKQYDFYCGEYIWSKEWSNPQGRGLDNDFVLQVGGEIIFDRATGLMWQQSGSGEYRTYEKAKAYIAQLKRGNWGGYSDWRLPTLEEAMSLMKSSKLNGDLYIDPKFDKTQRWIWTADKVSASVAWVAYFDDGGCLMDLVADSGSLFVRAVRGSFGQ